MNQPPVPRADSPERRKLAEPGFRFGCSGFLILVILGLLYWGGVTGLEHWLRVMTFGESTAGLIVMGRPEIHASAIIWIMLITLIIAAFSMNVRSAVRAMVSAACILGIGALVLIWTCHRHFEAMRPGSGSSVDLIYVWPRSSVRIDVRDARLSREMDTSYGGETAGPIYHLIIDAGGTKYSSASSGGLEEGERFLLARGARKAR